MINRIYQTYNEKFRNLSLVERKQVTERILDEVKGRMMEDAEENVVYLNAEEYLKML